MAHVIIPAAEELLDKEFQVHNKGFVVLRNYMGSDESVVQAARVSYGKGTKTFREDAGLIHYLSRHMHTSPFEMVEFYFHCKMPIFVARQWVRHRTASLNELSGRYSEMRDEFYIPSPEQVRKQSSRNKQGRDEEMVPPEIVQKAVAEWITKPQDEYWLYQWLLEQGIARELARINLPLSLYTEWYWKIDLHNLLHFLKLRLDEVAQWELRQYAKVIAKITKAVCPVSWEAFEEYQLFAVTFSRTEHQALLTLLKGEPFEWPATVFPGEDPTDPAVQEKINKRKKMLQREFEEKLKPPTNIDL